MSRREVGIGIGVEILATGLGYGVGVVMGNGLVGAIVLAAIGLVIIYFFWRSKPGNGKATLKANVNRTGIRMKDGRGRFKNTKIRNQDVSIDADNTDLKLEDTDIQ